MLMTMKTSRATLLKANYIKEGYKVFEIVEPDELIDLAEDYGQVTIEPVTLIVDNGLSLMADKGARRMFVEFTHSRMDREFPLEDLVPMLAHCTDKYLVYIDEKNDLEYVYDKLGADELTKENFIKLIETGISNIKDCEYVVTWRAIIDSL